MLQQIALACGPAHDHRGQAGLDGAQPLYLHLHPNGKDTGLTSRSLTRTTRPRRISVYDALDRLTQAKTTSS